MSLSRWENWPDTTWLKQLGEDGLEGNRGEKIVWLRPLGEGEEYIGHSSMLSAEIGAWADSGVEKKVAEVPLFDIFD